MAYLSGDEVHDCKGNDEGSDGTVGHTDQKHE